MQKGIMPAMSQIDLHVHSNYSDGTLTPKKLTEYAVQKGLSAFALTDHDTVDGIAEAVSCAPKGLEVIPGIELSTQYRGRDIHILGLYIDYQNKAFLERLKGFVDSRTLRNQKICALLQQSGIDITLQKLAAEFPGSVITRAHFAKYMLNHGYINSISEAFDRYIGDRGPCYVPREKITPAEAVKLILSADGIPVLAHPPLYHMSDAGLKELTALLKEAGLMGIEAVYSTYTAKEERQMRALAAQYHLLITGGSDFHGSVKPKIDLGTGTGKLFVSSQLLDKLRQSRKNLLFTDMDGTLLLNNSTVSLAVKKGLLGMTKAGHRLILTSGRPLYSILEVCAQIGLLDEKGTPLLPNMLVIANNGGLIYDCVEKKPILEHRISQKDIAYIAAKAKEAGLHIHGYTEKEIVWSPTDTADQSPMITADLKAGNDELRFYRSRIHLPLKTVSDLAAALPEGTYKLQMIHLTDKACLEGFRESMLPWCRNRLQMIFSNDQYLEILPEGAGKGNAVRFVTAYLPAMPSHTFAAGDAENDISMLQAAHTGIAMKNAAPQVKEAAAVITAEDNDHDGLLEIIDRYFS